MKIRKIFFSIMITSSILSLLACESTPNISLKDYSPVAIQTIYSNSGVPWYVNDRSSTSTEIEQEEEGLITGVINKAIDRNNPERDTAQDRINLAEKRLVEKMADLGITAITPKTNPTAPAYKKKGASFFDSASNYLPAEGYSVIKSNNNALNRSTAEETGAKAELYIAFKFKKETVIDGIHEIGVAARTEMQVFGADAKNKKIIFKTYTSTSAKYADLRNNKWDREEVCSYFPTTIESVINQFLMDFYDVEAQTAGVQSQEQSTSLEIPINVTGDKTENSEEATNKDKSPEEDPVLAQKKETARRLLKKGMSVTETAEMTDLTEEEVEALKD